MESLSFEEAFSQIDQFAGWMGKEDCRALWDQVHGMKGTIVEIGSFMGRSTKIMALSAPESTIIAIDPYESVHPSSGMDNPSKVKRLFKEAVKGLRVQLIAKRSQVVGKTWEKPIDFLHIDGDHHYEEVKADIELFVPHVKRGCYVFFHDYVVHGGKEEDGRDEYGIVSAITEKFSTYFDELKTISGFGVCRKK